MEKISVIVCAYNAEKTIVKCIDSIISNKLTYSGGEIDIQVIIVDDGSRDNTLQCLKEHYSNNSKVLILHQSNLGVAAARENALHYVMGDYIAFCDSDDWVDEDWLIMMYSALKKYNADVASFRVKIPGKEIQYDPTDVFEWNCEEVRKEFLIHKRINGTLCTKLFKAELFEDVHFDPSLSCFEDGDVLWQIFPKVSKVIRVNDARYNWNVSDTSLSNRKESISRLNSSIIFLNKVHRGINSDELESYFIHLQKNWLFGNLKSMYRCDLKDDAIESHIMKVLRTRPFETIGVLSGLVDKLFCILVMLYSPLARYIIQKIRVR